jgi:hypothetical protein
MVTLGSVLVLAGHARTGRYARAVGRLRLCSAALRPGRSEPFRERSSTGDRTKTQIAGSPVRRTQVSGPESACDGAVPPTAVARDFPARRLG